MPPTPSPVSVVIPYYQTSPEPLSRCIASIRGQQGVEMPNIIIVDDGSPLPAQDVLDAHVQGQTDGIRIIQQPNAGAAKARNTGLDNLPDSATVVAFLDSDDEWPPWHLSNALAVLNAGCDFYFADHKRSDWEVGKFAQLGFAPESHRPIDKDRKLYRYLGDPLEPILLQHLIQTSTVVYDRQSLADLRFPVDLVLGEDEVFWVRASRRARGIGFCAEIESYMGKGVNISQGGSWGDDRSLQMILQNHHFWHGIIPLLPGETGLVDIRERKLGELRDGFAGSILFKLRRRLPLPLREIVRFTAKDCIWVFSLGKILFKQVSKTLGAQ